MGECIGNFFCQNRYYRVFCGKVTGINEIQPQLFGFTELVIFHISGDKGIAPGLQYRGNFRAAGAAAHRNTAVEKVLSIMPHAENVIVKPGFFPESLHGLEDRFCLVSLDVDFYQTTLDGLRYFWPRLEPGGYLLLHDWGSPKLPGVAKALADFEAELRQRLPAVPLCDVGGSLVLIK